MKKTLQVQPLRRYAKPRYPAHSDPNPMDHPEALPYPFSQRVLDWALAVGVLGAGGCDMLSEPKPLLVNPFRYEQMGLPYEPVMFGTGQPERLESKKIREVAKQVCLSEGLDFVENYAWTDGRRAFPVSFMDTTLKIGIAVLAPGEEHRNYYLSYGNYWDRQEFDFESIFYMWERMEQHTPYRYGYGIEEDLLERKLSKKELEYMDMVYRISISEPTESDKMHFFAFNFHRAISEDAKSLINRVKIERAIQDKDIKAFCTEIKVEVFMRYLHRLKLPETWDKKVLDAYCINYRDIIEDKEKQERCLVVMRRAVTCIAEYNLPIDLRKQIVNNLDSFFTSYHPNWLEQLPLLLTESIEPMFDDSEILSLDESAQKGEAFIAVVSFEDLRFSYQFRDSDNVESKDHPRTPEERQQTFERSESGALKRLEDHLRMYIRWAKSQGKY